MTGLEYYNLDPELRQRLEKKSYWLFKSKHRWRKIENNLNCGAVELEKMFDRQIELTEKKLEIVRKLKQEQKNVRQLDKKNAGRNDRRGPQPNT